MEEMQFVQEENWEERVFCRENGLSSVVADCLCEYYENTGQNLFQQLLDDSKTIESFIYDYCSELKLSERTSLRRALLEFVVSDQLEWETDDPFDLSVTIEEWVKEKELPGILGILKNQGFQTVGDFLGLDRHGMAELLRLVPARRRQDLNEALQPWVKV
jgi:hypothetical protein